jgi:hypothetical protein
MYQSTEENTLVFYDHERTVRSLAYTIAREKSEAEYAEAFFDDDENVGAGTEFLYSENDLTGKAIVYYTVDKETDAEYWMLQGVKVKDTKHLFSTICYPTEEHKEWTIQTWNSIRD